MLSSEGVYLTATCGLAVGLFGRKKEKGDCFNNQIAHRWAVYRVPIGLASAPSDLFSFYPIDPWSQPTPESL